MKNVHQIHRDRRSALMRQMRAQSGGGLALVPTAPEVARNRDSFYPYRHDSYFYYLSGFPEPEAVIALVAGGEGPTGDRHILFCRDKNEEREIWDGFRYGPDAAREIFGFDEAHPIAELDKSLPDLAADRPALYTPLGLFAAWDRRVTDLLNEVRSRVRTGISAPEEIVDVRQALDALRLVKDEHELEADAPRRGDLRGRASPGDAAHAGGLVRIPGRGRAAARVSARRRAGRRLSVDRRRRSQRMRAALSRQQPPAAGRRAAADRRRLRISEATRRTSRARFRSTADSRARKRTSTSSSSPRSRRASTP